MQKRLSGGARRLAIVSVVLAGALMIGAAFGPLASAKKGPTWASVSKFVRSELPGIAQQHFYQGELVDGTYSSLIPSSDRYSGDQGECRWIYEQAGDPAVAEDHWADFVPIWQQNAQTVTTDGQNYVQLLHTFIQGLDLAHGSVPKKKRHAFTAAVSALKSAVQGTGPGHPKEFYELSAAYSDLAARNCDQSVTDSTAASTDGTTAWANEYRGLSQLAALFGVKVTITFAPPSPYA